MYRSDRPCEASSPTALRPVDRAVSTGDSPVVGPIRAAIVIFAGMAALLIAAPPIAAASTTQWCGADPGPVDQPDVTSALEIHLIYAVPSDAPDRFQELAPTIAADQEAIYEWWQRQDPSRSPRYDFFSSPGCPTRFCALDISHVRLSEPSSAFSGPTFGPLSPTFGPLFESLTHTPFTRA